MTIPTQQDPMHLHPWEQLLYDAGVHKGRFERGGELLGAVKTLSDRLSSSLATVQQYSAQEKEMLKVLDVAEQAAEELSTLLKNQQDAQPQQSQAADQLIIAANNERNQHELKRSRFTARSIAAIMEVTAGDRG
jgi:hypothetical protein